MLFVLFLTNVIIVTAVSMNFGRFSLFLIRQALGQSA